jgi:Prp8 binding protein
VLDLQWSKDAANLFTASADKSGVMWDTYDFSRVRTFRGHESHVNSISVTADFVVTGSDDCTVKLWDTRVRKHTASFNVGY